MLAHRTGHLSPVVSSIKAVFRTCTAHGGKTLGGMSREGRLQWKRRAGQAATGRGREIATMEGRHRKMEKET